MPVTSGPKFRLGALGLPWKPYPFNKNTEYCFWAAFAVYLVMVLALSVTRVPWWDEGSFADPAWNLATQNRLGSTSTDEWGTVYLPKIHEYTYWQFPGYLVLTGLLFKVTGLSVLAMRSISVVFGALYILGWRRLLLQLSDDRNFANLAAVLVAVDYSMLTAASNGRMDMMCASAGIGSLAMLATYARQGNLRMLAASGGCLTLSAVSHPTSVIYGCCWVILALYLIRQGWDWRAIGRPLHCLTLIWPAIMAFGLWSLYLFQDTEALRAQLASLSYRSQRIWNPLHILWIDLRERYWDFLFMPGVRGLKGLLFALQICAFAATSAIPSLRTGLTKLLALLTATAMVVLALLDTQRIPAYFVHAMPFLTIVLATALLSLSLLRPARWMPSALAAALFVLISLSGNGWRIWENAWKRDYIPMMNVVRPAFAQGANIMGGSELGFGIGFTSRLIDDRYLGLVTGKVPDLFVRNTFDGITARFPLLEERDRKLREEYDLILQNPNFSVYRRRK